MFFRTDNWAFQRTAPERVRPVAQALRLAVLGASLGGIVLASGCASGPKGADRSQGWYGPGQLPEFQRETASNFRPIPELEYVIGVGDKLDVVFLYQTNLTTRDVVVRRDGRISMPYVGDQMAAGVTPMTLDSLLTAHFSEILREPNLSVIVTTPAPQKVFVLGEVNAPGSFTSVDDVSMLQAVAMAGGLRQGAQPRHAVLIRREGVTKIVGIEVDLKSVMDGSKLSNDVWLRNYDVVFIPQHPIYTAADFMEKAVSIIGAPLDVVFKGWQVANLSASYEYFREGRNVP